MRRLLHLFLCILGVGPLSADSPDARASIAGTVHDPSGAVVASAKVTLEPLFPTGTRAETRTDGQGRFVFREAVPGDYRLVVRARGFKSQALETSLSTAGAGPVAISLEAEGLTEVVEVEAAAYVPTRATGATRTDTPIAETPQSVSVITREQIGDQHSQTMQEVVRYAPGVRAEAYGLDNRNDWFILRGSSESANVLDGLRVPLIGYWGGRQEPFAMERVEVLRGPSSLLVGPSSPGGVVNLVSKLPQPQSSREIALQLGNQDWKELTADLAGPLNERGTVLYRLLVLGRDSGTQVRHAIDDRQFVAPSVTLRPNPSTSFTAYGQYLREDTKSVVGFFPWAGTLEPAPHGRIPTETFLSEPDWDSYVVRRSRLGYHLEQRLGETFVLRHQLRHDRLEGELTSMYSNFWEGFLEDDRSLNRTWYATSYDGRTTTGDLLLQGDLQWGRTRHILLLGADALWLRDGTRHLGGGATPLDVYSPVYGTFTPPALAFGDETPTYNRQYGFFIQDQVKAFDRLILVGGLRRDHVESEVAGSPEAGSEDGAWSGRAGIVFRAGRGFSPYASYSESFDTVAGADLYGVPYKPRRGHQYEGGLRYSTAGRLNLTAALYTLEEENRLSPDPDDPQNQVQRGTVRVRGLELEATAALRQWDFTGSYTFTDGKTIASSDPADPYLNKRLLSVPRHSAALWVVRRFAVLGSSRLRAGAGIRYVGESWDGQDLLATPSNTLVDALLSAERGSWRLALNATNLLDSVYIATCIDRGDCWYGSRRKVVGTLGYHF